MTKTLPPKPVVLKSEKIRKLAIEIYLSALRGGLFMSIGQSFTNAKDFYNTKIDE